MNVRTPNTPSDNQDRRFLHSCRNCHRTARVQMDVGVCRWCLERGGPGVGRDPVQWHGHFVLSPQPLPFEPAGWPVWILADFLVCTAVGFVFVGAIQLITATHLHGLDLRGLLTFSALPHITCFALATFRLVAWGRKHVRLVAESWRLVDAAIALALAVTLMLLSWKHGPVSLYRAAAADSATYDLLLLSGVDVNACDSLGFCALTYAAEAGDERALIHLLERGADVDPTDTAGTPLTHAAAKGQLEIVKVLVGHGANLHATNRHDLTPLALAIKHGRTDVAAFLMQYTPEEQSDTQPSQRRF